MKKISISEIRLVLCETFPNSLFPDNITGLEIGDVNEWDSVGNFNFLLAIEEAFQVRFSMDEMSEIKSIYALLLVLEKKCSGII